MCKIYGKKLGIMFFYEQGQSSLTCINCMINLWMWFFLWGWRPVFRWDFKSKTLKDKSTYYSMEQYTCGDCNIKKDLDNFTSKNTTCNACLEKGRRWRAKNPDKVKAKWAEYYEEHKPEVLAKNREYRKTYNLIEVDCEVCECKVKKCRWSKHTLTKKHLDNLEVNSWNSF